MKPFKIHADFLSSKACWSNVVSENLGKAHVTGWNEAWSEFSMSCSWFHSSISILIGVARHIKCYLVTWNNELSIWSCERWFILQYSTKINKSELKKNMITWLYIIISHSHKWPESLKDMCHPSNTASWYPIWTAWFALGSKTQYHIFITGWQKEYTKSKQILSCISSQ